MTGTERKKRRILRERRRAERRRKLIRNRIATAMAVTIVTLIIVLLCMKFTARETIAEEKSRFSKKYYKSYMIEYGDTLWTIAEKNCGTEWKNNWDYIDEVMRINGITYSLATRRVAPPLLALFSVVISMLENFTFPIWGKFTQKYLHLRIHL